MGLQGVLIAYRRLVITEPSGDTEVPVRLFQPAKKIIDLMVKHGAEQNAVLAEIEPICSADEFQNYKRMIGQSMGSLLLNVINPIVELHPDLKPSQLE